MNDKNLIINVGRQLGSGGRSIARLLADEFACKFYDRELLNLAAKERILKVALPHTYSLYARRQLLQR